MDIVSLVVDTVGSWGYLGIFIMMTLESSFFPFPSEVAMIPAGYLVHQGEMTLLGALGAGIGGSIAGAIFNYYLSYWLGRDLIIKYGRYVGITETKMQKFEAFFAKHGEIATFNCRLIPGIRQYISLPAGLAQMNMAKFIIFTGLGAGIWCVVLVAIGYYLGINYNKGTLTNIVLITLGVVILVSIGYIAHQRARKN